MTAAMSMEETLAPILSVRALTTEFRIGNKYVRALDGVSLDLMPGEIVAIVGESGSGKSVLLQSILGLARGRPGVVSGAVELNLKEEATIRPFEAIESAVQRRVSPDGQTRSAKVSRRFTAQVERRLAPVRGRGIGLVLQNGRAALDPFWPIGRQIEAAIADRYPEASAEARKTQAHDWLMRLGFVTPENISGAYPFELSGGMAQRAMLAVVLAREPQILFLDEITTGLDVSLQASVLKLLQRLHARAGFAALLVTHDLGLARNISSRTVIMQRGHIVQTGETRAIFDRQVPLEPYTAQLLNIGRLDGMHRPRLTTDSIVDPQAAPLIVANQIGKRFATRPTKGGWRAKPEILTALSEVSVEIPRGQSIALVGESGSGKTTLSRILVGLLRPDAGEVQFDGRSLAQLDPRGVEQFRRRRTILFQNPYTSLNPEMSAEDVLAEALDLYRSILPRIAKRRASSILERLSLGRRARNRLAELSGGERRRVGLLRAMQSNADLIVLDEPTAGLDAVHKSEVVELIRSLRDHRPERALIIVSHDLGFVSRVADRILVLYRGHLVEDVGVEDFMDPHTVHHPYTELLWNAARYVGGQQAQLTMPPEARTDLREVDGPNVNGSGCLYRGRCPIYNRAPDDWSVCTTDVPALRVVDEERRIACHGVTHDNNQI